MLCCASNTFVRFLITRPVFPSRLSSCYHALFFLSLLPCSVVYFPVTMLYCLLHCYHALLLASLLPCSNIYVPVTNLYCFYLCCHVLLFNSLLSCSFVFVSCTTHSCLYHCSLALLYVSLLPCSIVHILQSCSFFTSLLPCYCLRRNHHVLFFTSVTITYRLHLCYIVLLFTLYYHDLFSHSQYQALLFSLLVPILSSFVSVLTNAFWRNIVVISFSFFHLYSTRLYGFRGEIPRLIFCRDFTGVVFRVISHSLPSLNSESRVTSLSIVDQYWQVKPIIFSSVTSLSVLSVLHLSRTSFCLNKLTKSKLIHYQLILVNAFYMISRFDFLIFILWTCLQLFLK